MWDEIKIGNDLNLEMAMQPSLYAFYGSLLAEAKTEVKRAKARVYCFAEDEDRRLRALFKEEGKRYTEASLKARINRSVKMRQLREEAVEAGRKFGHLLELKEVLKQRAEMLRSIGANRRRDVEHEADIVTQERNEPKQKRKHLNGGYAKNGTEEEG